jgi:hypothetical protein
MLGIDELAGEGVDRFLVGRELARPLTGGTPALSDDSNFPT